MLKLSFAIYLFLKKETIGKRIVTTSSFLGLFVANIFCQGLNLKKSKASNKLFKQFLKHFLFIHFDLETTYRQKNYEKKKQPMALGGGLWL